MNDFSSHTPPPVLDDADREMSGSQSSSTSRKRIKKKHISMHEGIGVWADCCSCEAEPYWRELADDMGVDLNEYEEDEFESDDADEESGKTR